MFIVSSKVATPKLEPGNIIQLNTELAQPSPFYFGYKIQEKFLSKLEDYSFDNIFFFTKPHLFELYGKELYEQIIKKFSCTLEFLLYCTILDETVHYV